MIPAVTGRNYPLCTRRPPNRQRFSHSWRHLTDTLDVTLGTTFLIWATPQRIRELLALLVTPRTVSPYTLQSFGDLVKPIVYPYTPTKPRICVLGCTVCALTWAVMGGHGAHLGFSGPPSNFLDLVPGLPWGGAISALPGIHPGLPRDPPMASLDPHHGLPGPHHGLPGPPPRVILDLQGSSWSTWSHPRVPQRASCPR